MQLQQEPQLPRDCFTGQLIQPGTIDEYVAALRCPQTRQRMQRECLACPVGAEYADEVAGRELNTQAGNQCAAIHGDGQVVAGEPPVALKHLFVPGS